MPPHELFGPETNPTLYKSLPKYFTSGQFSDMKIKCGEVVYAAHRIIVCGQSRFFANAMEERSNFKEAHTKMVELHDHPAAVKAMLEFMYTDGYDDFGFGGRLEDRVLFHIELYATADKYQIGHLKKYASHEIEVIIDNPSWDVSMEVLGLIVSAAFEKTPESDVPLRMLMVRMISKDLDKVIQDTDFIQNTENPDGFYLTVIRSLVSKKNVLEAQCDSREHYKCPVCRAYTHCPSCGEAVDNEKWMGTRHGKPGDGWAQ